MYVLLIDAGNTRIKWRLLQQGKNHSQGVVEHSALPHWPAADTLTEVVVASVIEQPTLQHQLELLYGTEKTGSVDKLRWLHHPLPSFAGFQHCYAHPERLGVDRWLAMLGARCHSQKAVMVVDAGTALTIDLFSAKNEHQGGYIVPGVQMAQNALFNNTAKVKPFADEQSGEKIAPGQDTYGCVVAGIQRQRLSLVHSVIQDFPHYQVFVCGGDGQWLAQQLNLHYYNNLVLDGMESLCVGSL